MEFQPGEVAGVIWRPLVKYQDGRGWLCEVFRQDELPPEFYPVMGYLSVTAPGVARGPHQHAEQADCFGFLGPSNFLLRMWDTRPGSPSYGAVQSAVVGADNPTLVIIPPGIVHGYKNIGPEPGLVVNCPNRLYRGPGRQDPVDEIRHEDDPHSPFHLGD